jgi:peptidoglycan/LPS O-acetylase OafA/YrhL
MTIAAVPAPPTAPADAPTAGGAAAAPAPAPEASVRLRRPHLHQVDVVRLLTFAAVIGVHSIAFTEPPSNQAWAGVLMLLQFGREVFFALTGFVLVYSAGDRPLPARAFWRKRFPLIAAPYLAWSAIYTLFHRFGPAHLRPSWHTVLWDVVTGNSEYHLYFLLVSLQLYLVFPLLLRFVRRTAPRPWPVLVVVGALNTAWFAWLQYGHAPSNWVGHLWPRAYELLPTYAVYVLIGCYAAVHLERVDRVMRERRRTMVAVGAGAALIAELVFWAQVGGRDPRLAAAVLQPAMALTSIAALIGLYLAGTAWTARGCPGAAFMTRASDLSFAVYLAHPLVLELLLHAGLGNGGQKVPAVLATALAMAGTAVGASVIAFVARETVWSLPLTGRPRRRAGRPGSADQPLRRVTEASQAGFRA